MGYFTRNGGKGPKLFFYGINTPRRDFYRDTAKRPSKCTKKKGKKDLLRRFLVLFLPFSAGFLCAIAIQKKMLFACNFLTLADAVLIIENGSKVLAFKGCDVFLEVLDVCL